MSDAVTLNRDGVERLLHYLKSHKHVARELELLLEAALAAPQPVHGLQHIHDAIMADPSVCDIDDPVAWLVTFENGEQELHFDKQCVGDDQVPLYAEPQPEPQPVKQATIKFDRKPKYIRRTEP